MAKNSKSFSDRFGLNDDSNQSRSAERMDSRSVESLLEELISSVNGLGETFKETVADMSQSNARVGSGRSNDPQKEFRRREQNKKESDGPKDFMGGLKKELFESFFGRNFKKSIGNVAVDFAKKLGTDVEHLPGRMGQLATRSLINVFKKTETGKQVTSAFEDIKSQAAGKLKSFLDSSLNNLDFSEANPEEFLGGLFKSAKSAFFGGGPSAAGAAEASQSAVQAASGVAGMAETAGTATAAMSSLSSVVATVKPMIAAAGPYILAAVAAIGLLTLATKLLGPEFEEMKKSAKEFMGQLSTSANRYAESRKKNLELSQKRLKDDVETMIRTPFEIMEDAAKKAYDAWDNTLRTITATQGYSKADYQDLLAAFADRLREENLSNVVAVTDIASNLQKVLESGLTGRIAEEFAYKASVLGAAIPTQDFFGYADAYASIVANLVKDGVDQEKAIQKANSQLDTFANSVLYAGRELSGGITTGLKDAQGLFEKSVQISQAARTNNASEIAGVLTAVSAVTGAVAPDLASGIVDAIFKAATGGNESSIVALRSIAGINASNTEFLKAFAKDPKKVFSTLFSNLDKYAGMAPDAYMEVAEGLSSIFGISPESFARVDFKYLASAISQMNVDSSALDKNMKMLIDGETTTSAEIHRIQEVNKYLLDEGLSLVLDNEAARAIQQHMWDEQLAREMMEAEYGVELTGKTAQLMESIRMFIEKIAKLLNPFKWVTESVINIAGTAAESAAQQADIKNLLVAGKVGKFGEINAKSLYQLTTRNADLNLTSSLLSKFGSVSLYETAKGAREGISAMVRAARNPSILNISDMSKKLSQGVSYLLGNVGGYETSLSSFNKSRSSYKWGTVSKSDASLLSTLAEIVSDMFGGHSDIASSIYESGTTAVSLLAARFKKMTDPSYIAKLVSEGKSYSDWEKSAASFGIQNLEEAMQELSVTRSQVEEAFLSEQTRRGEEIQQELQEKEKQFWEQSEIHFKDAKAHYETFVSYFEASSEFFATTTNYEESVVSWLEGISEKLGNTSADSVYSKVSDLLKDWTEYYIYHKYYDEGRWTAAAVDELRSKEKQTDRDAVLLLADTLAGGQADLRDPAVQTNALLSKILVLVEAILNQGSVTGGTTLIDSMTALSLGLTKRSDIINT